MRSFAFLLAVSMLGFISCSTISKNDCDQGMLNLGMSHGKSGSPKKYTDELSKVCSHKSPPVDLEAYEKGFALGWAEYCLPNRAFEMGKKSDRYYSFCPPERESLFREKYLIGKHHAELKDVEEEIVIKMDEIKPNINKSATAYDDYLKLQKELDKTRREIQALEVEGLSNSFKFR